jgi:peroxiredoxin
MRILLPIVLLAAACGPTYVAKPSGFGATADDEVATEPWGDDDDDDGATDEEATTSEPSTDPTLDSDGDGVPDVVELEHGGDPFDPDTDGDGWDDGEEIEQNTNPLSASSVPYTGGWAIDDCHDELTGQGNGVGQVASDFTLVDQFGDDLRLHDFCGRAVVLVASAMWCGPCQSEAGELAGLYRQYEDQGLMVITLLGEDYGGRTPDQGDLQDWANSFGIDHPVVADPGFSVASRFVTGGTLYLPSTSLLGEGAVVLLRDRALSTNDIVSALP